MDASTINLSDITAFLNVAQKALDEHLAPFEDLDAYDAEIARLKNGEKIKVPAPWGEETIHVYSNDIDEPVAYVTVTPVTDLGNAVVDYAGEASGYICGFTLSVE